MKCNVGKTDKTIRWVIAVLGLVLGFAYNPWFYLLTVVGAFTASTGFCLLYELLGINTCDNNHDHKPKSHDDSCCAPSNDSEDSSSIDNTSSTDVDKSETSQE